MNPFKQLEKDCGRVVAHVVASCFAVTYEHTDASGLNTAGRLARRLVPGFELPSTGLMGFGCFEEYTTGYDAYPDAGCVGQLRDLAHAYLDGEA